MNEQAWISGGCPFKGKRIDSKGNIKYKGHMIVSSYELQFVLSKPRGKDDKKIEKELFMFKDIKSYGCHENVLSVRLGGASSNMNTEQNMVYFKLKEAVVVKELMDQVIEMKKKPTPRMPSFDFGGGFYDMSPSQNKNRPGVERKHSLQHPLQSQLQDNMSYYDPSRGQQANSAYSRARLERSLSTTSTSSGSSCSGPLSAGIIPGYDNPLFGTEPIPNVQYAQVETVPTITSPTSPEDPFSPPAPNTPHPSGSGKKKFPLFRSKSTPKFGYTKVDIEVMEALRELDVRKEYKK